MVYDQARGVCVLHDGGASPELETWGWNGSEWTLLGLGSPFSSIGGHSMAYDSRRQVVVLFGGAWGGHLSHDTWEWDGIAWTHRKEGTPGERTDQAMAYDSARGVTVMFGGVYSDDQETEYYDQTWEWDGEVWDFIADIAEPSPRAFHRMAFDSARGVTVLNGGFSPDNPNAVKETWEWDGKVWTLRDAEGPVRDGSAMVYSDHHNACILFGGAKASTKYNETWAYDGNAWTLLDTPIAPPKRTGHVMAYDSARRVIVMFGGTNAFGDPLFDTWEFVCESCYPDFDDNGSLDLFDFLGFLNAFNESADTADCDQNASLDFFDFLCFANAFNEGCP